jgi:predicted nucleotidyltransferase
MTKQEHMRMTVNSPHIDEVLVRFRAAVTEIYGDRLERVVLFGSRARGDAKTDSDYDIAVFIEDAGTFSEESERLAAISTDILLDTGAVISATPFIAGTHGHRTGFMHELRKHGLDL